MTGKRRIRVVSDGRPDGTTLVDADTGEDLRLPVIELSWAIGDSAGKTRGDSPSTLHVVMLDVGADLTTQLGAVGVTVIPTSHREAVVNPGPVEPAIIDRDQREPETCAKCGKSMKLHGIQKGVWVCP